MAGSTGTMKAFQGHRLGEVEAFAVEERAVGTPGAGEMLLRVEATALGFVDALVMRGLYQVQPAVPFVPGGEIVGRIVALGAGVTGFLPGQRIASWQFGGGLAERAIVKAANSVAVPDDLPSPEASALILDFLTAYYGLFDRGQFQAHYTLLVTGASGGVGSAAVQLAHASGGSVIALASGEAKLRHVARLGADMVLDYRNPDWRAALKARFPGGVDRVFDPVGGSLLEPCFRSLAKHGRHLVVGFASGEGIAKLPTNLPLLKSGELAGVDARYLGESDPERVREILGVIFRMASRQQIRPVIAQTFALADAPAAFRALAAGDRIGKVVVLP
ncbi:NADPH:quinone oxidoreductase family protein [Blastomonas sp. AAP53]|uniref:NADPH:quinone oxidoreductase family protein n=1 Tax=Blastomonas sp. AAP53 TaxID=1248760 RepID=UPI0002F27B28|nr:NADPH:quinone oxidoreductase family protein [Blastomonas sp. AAP53]